MPFFLAWQKIQSYFFLTSFLVTALNFTQHCWALVTFTESIFFTIIEFVIHYFFFCNFTTASCEKLNKIQTTAVLNLQIMCLAHFITLHLHTVSAADYIHILYVHCNIYIFLKKSGSSTSFFPPSISYLATKLMQHFQGLFFFIWSYSFLPEFRVCQKSFHIFLPVLLHWEGEVEQLVSHPRGFCPGAAWPTTQKHKSLSAKTNTVSYHRLNCLRLLQQERRVLSFNKYAKSISMNRWKQMLMLCMKRSYFVD